MLVRRARERERKKNGEREGSVCLVVLRVAYLARSESSTRSARQRALVFTGVPYTTLPLLFPALRTENEKGLCLKTLFILKVSHF